MDGARKYEVGYVVTAKLCELVRWTGKPLAVESGHRDAPE